MAHRSSFASPSRQAFDATLPLPAFHATDPDALLTRPEILDCFNRFGFVLLRGQDAREPTRSMLRWQAVFGAIWRHDRSDPTGLALVTPRSGRSDFGPAYLGVSSLEHPPHTDGAYHGDPPQIVMLYCERPAALGGESLLVSGKRLYQSMASHPRELRALHAPDALTIIRGGQSTTTAVFPAQDRQRIVFRTDSAAALVPSLAARVACERLRKAALQPANQLRFTMQTGDLLVIDNTAVLHGRTAFATTQTPEHDRRFWRLAFERSHPSLVLGFDAHPPGRSHAPQSKGTRQARP